MDIIDSQYKHFESGSSRELHCDIEANIRTITHQNSDNAEECLPGERRSVSTYAHQQFDGQLIQAFIRHASLG